MGHQQTNDPLQITHDLITLWKQDHLYSTYLMGIAFGNVKNRDEMYKYNIHDLYQLIFEFNYSQTIHLNDLTYIPKKSESPPCPTLLDYIEHKFIFIRNINIINGIMNLK